MAQGKPEVTTRSKLTDEQVESLLKQYFKPDDKTQAVLDSFRANGYQLSMARLDRIRGGHVATPRVVKETKAPTTKREPKLWTVQQVPSVAAPEVKPATRSSGRTNAGNKEPKLAFTSPQH
jgi:hypothetical protein